MEEIQLRQTNNSRKSNENKIVEFHFEKFLFMITRFKRINWKEYKGAAQYQYFLYIFDKRLELTDEEVFNSIIRENVYPTFESLIDILDAILSEFILVEDAIFDCLKQVEELDPIYLDKE